MKTGINIALVFVAALGLMAAVGPWIAPPVGPVEITTADSGSITREKYLAAYRAGLRQAAADFAVRVRAAEFKDSYAAVKAWSEMARAAGAGAAKGVDARVAELCREPRAKQIEWIEDFSR